MGVDMTMSENEPVAWMFECNGKQHLTFTNQSEVEKENPSFPKSVPLYTHPAPAVAQEPVHADESMWCRYIATIIGGYLGEPVGSDKEKAIAGIIERRLWNLPKKEAPAVAVNEQMRTALEGLLAIVSDSQGVAGYHLNGEVAEWDEFEEVEAASAAIAAAEAAKKGGAA